MIKVNILNTEPVYNYPVYAINDKTKDLIIWHCSTGYTLVKKCGRGSLSTCTHGDNINNAKGITLLKKGDFITLVQE